MRHWVALGKVRRIAADEAYRLVELDPSLLHLARIVALGHVDDIARLGVFHGFPDVFERRLLRTGVLVGAGGERNVNIGRLDGCDRGCNGYRCGDDMLCHCCFPFGWMELLDL